MVQVGQTMLKGRPDKRNLRLLYQISPCLSYFDLTFYTTFSTTFHYESIKSLFKEVDVFIIINSSKYI